MANSLFRKKSIAQIQSDAAQGFADAERDGTGLRRSLGTFDLTMMGIAAIIGAGIFAMVGEASFHGGPGVIFLFIFAAIACGFAALCYAEFASKIPIAGSAYTYAYASFGELLAWIIGWDLLVEYAIGNIAVAISWSDYFSRLLIANGINIPAYVRMDYLSASRGFAESHEVVEAALSQGQNLDALSRMTVDQLKTVSDSLSPLMIKAYAAWTTAPHFGNWPVILDLPALGIVFVITALVYVGIRESKVASNIMVGIKLGIILLVIIVGAFFVKTANWVPFLPNGFTGVMSGVAAVFFAYIGFDALSTTAEECKDPYKTLPRGMIYSLVICTVLYVTIALVLTGMVSYKSFEGVGDPLAFVFGPQGVNIPWISGLIAVGAIFAIATVLLVFQLGQPRLWMAMSRDGLLPKIFSSIHPRFRTPWFSTILTGFMVAIPALFMNLSEVTDLSVIGTLFAFTIVCAGVLVKDKEFAGQKRFVPYLSSRYIGVFLFLVGLFLVVYLHGVSSLNAPVEEGALRLTFDKSQPEMTGKYDVFDRTTLANPEVYKKGFSSLADLFTADARSENLVVKYGTPKSSQTFSIAPDRKILYEGPGGEKEVPFVPDASKATNDKTYLFGFTPVVIEEKTTTPALESPTMDTIDGPAQISISREESIQPWLSAYSHKIPYTVFLLFTIFMTVLCFVKKLSLIPVLGVMCCAYLMTELGWTNWFRFGIWMIVGFIIYFFYSYSHSKLHKREEAAEV